MLFLKPHTSQKPGSPRPFLSCRQTLLLFTLPTTLTRRFQMGRSWEIMSSDAQPNEFSQKCKCPRWFARGKTKIRDSNSLFRTIFMHPNGHATFRSIRLKFHRGESRQVPIDSPNERESVVLLYFEPHKERRCLMSHLARKKKRFHCHSESLTPSESFSHMSGFILTLEHRNSRNVHECRRLHTHVFLFFHATFLHLAHRFGVKFRY